MTKYVDGELIKTHLKAMIIDFREGRMQLAAQLSGGAQLECRCGGTASLGPPGRRVLWEEEEKNEVENGSREHAKTGNRGPTAAAARKGLKGDSEGTRIKGALKGKQKVIKGLKNDSGDTALKEVNEFKGFKEVEGLEVPTATAELKATFIGGRKSG